MVFSSDTPPPPDQITRPGCAGRLLWALWTLSCLVGTANLAHGQVLCPAATYAEDALTGELGLSRSATIRLLMELGLREVSKHGKAVLFGEVV